MEKDSEMYHDEDIKVEDRSIGNKLFENDENNQNLLNNSVLVTQLIAENRNIETLPKQSLIEIETYSNNSNNTEKYHEKDDPSPYGESNIEIEDEPILFCNKRSKKSKLVAILDSDSENEEKSLYSPIQNVENCSELLQTNQIGNDIKNEDSQIASKKLRRIAFIDSDSEEDSERNKLEKLCAQSGAKVADSLSPTNLINEASIEVKEIQLTDQKKILSTLCDSESSDDNSNENDYENITNEQISDGEVDALQANAILPSKSRKSKPKKTKNAENSEKMTAKKAVEQKKEIFSESQRRIRESRISLPYHKPKSRSLKEFLENRPKLASALTNVHQALSPSAAIKMTMEQLVIVSKKLKEREKEVQQFYKSESESESEDIPNDSVNMKSDDLTGKVEALTDNTDNIKQQLECKEMENYSEVDVVGQCNPNDEIICMNIDTEENREKPELTTSLDTIPKSDENTDNYSFDSEIINLNLNDHQNGDVQVENIRERKQESMDTLESPNIASDALIEHEEEMKIDPNVHRETVTRQESNGDLDMKSVDNIEEVEKAKDLTESVVNIEEVEKGKDGTEHFFDENLFDSKKPEKLIILSDVILKPSHSEKPANFYSLDDELLDLASDIKKSEQESDKYDFNLDDIEDEFEHVKEDNNETKEEKINEDKGELQKNRKLELLEKLGSLKPRLSGGPNEVIDLENGLTMPDEVSKLRERFLQHNIKIGKHKHKKEISILSVTHGEIRKETLALNVDEDDEENTAPLEKPGVRLQKLREELEYQMAQRRSDMWKEKHNQTSKSKEENDEETDDDKSNCGVYDILDNDEEEELTESEEEDEELEENDCDMSEKKKRKSAFVEEEAAESDLEEDESGKTQFKDNSEEINEMNEEILEEEDEDADAEDNVETEELEDEVPKKRVLKRILKPFNNDDSEDDDDDDMVPQKNQMLNGLRNNTYEKVNSDDEFLPPHQPTNYKVREPISTPTKSQLDFFTPVTYMTGLQNLNTSGSRVVVPMNTSSDDNISHISDLSADRIGLKSQLSDVDFPNTQELIDMAINKDVPELSPPNGFLKPIEQSVLCTQDILEICSGNFPTSSKSISSPEISTQQLREIFTGNSQKSDFNTQDIGDICSGQFTEVTLLEKDKNEEIALDEKEENIISQLIDEEELERFKKKFESPVATNTQKTIDFEHTEEVQGTGGVIDSDDGDDELHLKKKKSKRLAFSDEESEDDLVTEETIDLHDDEDVASSVDYDSEENEVDPEEKRQDTDQIKREKLKASDFFENEAELSESEWGSEDEDEKNLDDMEFEKGDEDKFDDDKLRSDIERVQMRQMLDDDNREVKLLQELLLEDGELHGTGRQRQFRWKNIDAAGNEAEETKFDDGDAYLDDDDESEEQWRKMRHEREMFMMKKQSQVEEDNVLIESQRLSFTHKTLKIKSQSHTATEAVTSSPQIKQQFGLLNKRGSFLSRSDQILQKFAEATKVSVGTRTTGRIVFQAVDEELKKRKASSQETDSTPVALKKLRLSDLSPALQKIKPKVGKSLFGTLMID